MADFSLFDALRRQRPLVHCISNLVTANACANVVLAVGGSPIMAQSPEEMEEITAAACALVLNTGTPSAEKFAACRVAGLAAQRLAHPIVLDPVGAGASRWRAENLIALLEQVHPTLLRLNFAETAALLGQSHSKTGVDSFAQPTTAQRLAAAQRLAMQYSCTVLLSGESDIITDGAAGWQVRGGSRKMRQITGAGCMLSALCGAVAAVEPDPVQAAVLAAAFWKSCAYQAEHSANAHGTGSFQVALLDAAGGQPAPTATVAPLSFT